MLRQTQTMRIRVLRPFWLERTLVQIGTEREVPTALGAAMVAAQKAEQLTERHIVMTDKEVDAMAKSSALSHPLIAGSMSSGKEKNHARK